jgi:hypothetical protein
VSADDDGVAGAPPLALITSRLSSRHGPGGASTHSGSLRRSRAPALITTGPHRNQRVHAANEAALVDIAKRRSAVAPKASAKRPSMMTLAVLSNVVERSGAN